MPIIAFWLVQIILKTEAFDTMSKLPIGVQLVGRPFDEMTLPRIAHIYEEYYGSKGMAIVLFLFKYLRQGFNLRLGPVLI